MNQLLESSPIRCTMQAPAELMAVFEECPASSSSRQIQNRCDDLFPIHHHIMEPIDPVSQRATQATRLLDSLMTVQPLLWVMEVERANQCQKGALGLEVRSASYTVWRELAHRSRQRGTAMLSRKQWPGSVFLPSWIVKNLLSQGSIVTPMSWGSMASEKAAKLIALLVAWQGDRGIYEFSVLPSKIIRQSEVDVVLDIKTFSDMPSFALYIDLENVRDPLGYDNVPSGFLVGLNMQNETFELVMASLDVQNIVVETLPLDGSTLDSYLFNTSKGDSGPGKKGRLSVMLAALLMVCFYNKKAELVLDGSADFGIVKVWSRWRLGEKFSDSIAREYQASKLRTSSMNPSVVAHWGPLEGNDHRITLRCSMGLAYSLNKFQLAKVIKPLSVNECGQPSVVLPSLSMLVPGKHASKGPKKKSLPARMTVKKKPEQSAHLVIGEDKPLGQQTLPGKAMPDDLPKKKIRKKP